MSERRYVVELTKVVPASRLPAAAQEIARRLGLEVPRVVTLLQDRVGPVTKPVLAAKADAIATVFQEAGVDVAIYDASSLPYQTLWETEPTTPPSAGPTAAPTPEPAAGASAEDAEAEDAPDAAAPGDREYGPVAPVPDLGRWEVDDPWSGLDPWRDAAPFRPQSEHDDAVTVVEVGEPGEAAVRAAAPARGADDPSPDVPVAVRQVGDDASLPPVPGPVTVRSGVWEEALPRRDRRPLRAFLLIALGVALALLLALQLAYRPAAAAVPAYDAGLAAYRAGEFALARRHWERAASGGSPAAEFMLGYLAQHGLGRQWSYREAAERYRVAADAGLPEAQLALGELYLEGLGVEPDPRVGAEWVERAASAGHGPALHRLGELLFHGVGFEQDFDAALAAFAAAAARGSGAAADYLALAAHLRGANVSAP